MKTRTLYDRALCLVVTVSALVPPTYATATGCAAGPQRRACCCADGSLPCDAPATADEVDAAWCSCCEPASAPPPAERVRQLPIDLSSPAVPAPADWPSLLPRSMRLALRASLGRAAGIALLRLHCVNLI